MKFGVNKIQETLIVSTFDQLKGYLLLYKKTLLQPLYVVQPKSSRNLNAAA
jgi:hypothetical protein